MAIYWDKAPRDLVSLAWSARWDKENQAPELVGYMLAQRVILDGGSLPIRTLAKHCGWSRHVAERVLRRVKTDTGTDNARTKTDTGTDNRPPDNLRNRCESRTKTDTGTDNARTKTDIARVPLSESRVEREENNPPNAPQGAGRKPSRPIAATWTQIVEVCRDHPTAGPVPQAKIGKKFRAKLSTLLGEFTPDEICRAVLWWRTSEHPRAQMLREKGLSVMTVFRHMEEYLTFAQCEPATASPSPDRPHLPDDAAVLAWLQSGGLEPYQAKIEELKASPYDHSMDYHQACLWVHAHVDAGDPSRVVKIAKKEFGIGP